MTVNTLTKRLEEEGIDIANLEPQKAFKAWSLITELTEEHSSEALQSLYQCAKAASHSGHIETSNNYLYEAKAYCNQLDDKETALKIYTLLSNNYTDMGDYHSALSSLLELATLASEYGDMDAYVHALVGIGNLCVVYGNHKRAMQYFDRIARVDHLLNSMLLRLRYRLFTVSSLLELHDTATAHKMLMQCEEMAKIADVAEQDEHTLVCQIALYRAKLQRLQGNNHKALNTLSKAKLLSRKHNTFWMRGILAIEAAKSLIQLGKPDTAAFLIQRQLSRADLTVPTASIKSLLETQSRAYTACGLFFKALERQKLAHEISKNIIQRSPISDLEGQVMRKLSNLELKFRLIVSEKENKLLKAAHEYHKNTVAQLEEDVYRDALTGLYNRRGLDKKLDELTKKTSVSLLILDIDHFKAVNDELSHLTGDKVLETLGELINRYFRKEAFATRFGGEEFVILLEHSNLAVAWQTAEVFRKLVETYDWSAYLPDRTLTVSIGVTQFATDNEKIKSALYRADKALYTAKAKGRNAVCIEPPSPKAKDVPIYGINNQGRKQ